MIDSKSGENWKLEWIAIFIVKCQVYVHELLNRFITWPTFGDVKLLKRSSVVTSAAPSRIAKLDSIGKIITVLEMLARVPRHVPSANHIQIFSSTPNKKTPFRHMSRIWPINLQVLPKRMCINIIATANWWPNFCPTTLLWRHKVTVTSQKIRIFLYRSCDF